ncbi:unnamed protein product [Sphenostylis stenocarpa]|uniref:Uncharacterized protein n=1 Tax=Sphenostylis stenocarpa TaxID=92480 RepID=A0AA86T618_9FABA|nr:unnamed protein product [Sphenostylis stenocarpa]
MAIKLFIRSLQWAVERVRVLVKVGAACFGEKPPDLEIGTEEGIAFISSPRKPKTTHWHPDKFSNIHGMEYA